MSHCRQWQNNFVVTTRVGLSDVTDKSLARARTIAQRRVVADVVIEVVEDVRVVVDEVVIDSVVVRVVGSMNVDA